MCDASCGSGHVGDSGGDSGGGERRTQSKANNAMPLQLVKRVRLTAVLPLHLVMTPNAGRLCHRVRRQLEVLALC